MSNYFSTNCFNVLKPFGNIYNPFALTKYTKCNKQ